MLRQRILFGGTRKTDECEEPPCSLIVRVQLSLRIRATLWVEPCDSSRDAKIGKKKLCRS